MDYRALRTRCQQNQTHFWQEVGVSQTMGSRYESGHPVPDAVADRVRTRWVHNVPIRNLGEAAERARTVLIGIRDGRIKPRSKEVVKAIEALTQDHDNSQSG